MWVELLRTGTYDIGSQREIRIIIEKSGLAKMCDTAALPLAVFRGDAQVGQIIDLALTDDSEVLTARVEPDDHTHALAAQIIDANGTPQLIGAIWTNKKSQPLQEA